MMEYLFVMRMPNTALREQYVYASRNEKCSKGFFGRRVEIGDGMFPSHRFMFSNLQSPNHLPIKPQYQSKPTTNEERDCNAMFSCTLEALPNFPRNNWESHTAHHHHTVYLRSNFRQCESAVPVCASPNFLYNMCTFWTMFSAFVTTWKCVLLFFGNARPTQGSYSIGNILSRAIELDMDAKIGGIVWTLFVNVDRVCGLRPFPHSLSVALWCTVECFLSLHFEKWGMLFSVFRTHRLIYVRTVKASWMRADVVTKMPV